MEYLDDDSSTDNDVDEEEYRKESNKVSTKRPLLTICLNATNMTLLCSKKEWTINALPFRALTLQTTIMMMMIDPKSWHPPLQGKIHLVQVHPRL